MIPIKDESYGISNFKWFSITLLVIILPKLQTVRYKKGGGNCFIICVYISIYIYIYIYIYHHVVLLARISLTLSCHSSLLFITSGRSSGLRPVSSQSYYMYVWAGRPAFVRPYEGIHRSTSLMSSSLLLQQCPACLVHLTWIVFVIGGKWPYSWCFVGCCLYDLFSIARSIFV